MYLYTYVPMWEQHGVERSLTVKNGLWRYYNNFNYCKCNAVDSPHRAITLIIKLPTTYLDTTICRIILLPWCSPYWLVRKMKNLCVHLCVSVCVSLSLCVCVNEIPVWIFHVQIYMTVMRNTLAARGLEELIFHCLRKIPPAHAPQWMCDVLLFSFLVMVGSSFRSYLRS